MAMADDARDINEVCKKVVGEYLCNRTITISFEQKGTGKVKYSHRQHTCAEAQYGGTALYTSAC